MGKDTEIAWTDSTFNPWWGCQRVSPGCENCYAEAFSRRVGQKVWGPTADRRFFGDKHWAEPLKWNAAAGKAGKRHRVFCASMADVFEDRRDLDDQRARLWRLIEATPNLDWLLLTKRPESMLALAPAAWNDRGWPINIWAGTTVEDQRRADERIQHLLCVPARVRFLSVEPQIGPIDFGDSLTEIVCSSGHVGGQGYASNPMQCRCGAGSLFRRPVIHWAIVGGESGAHARPFELAWAREIVRQCKIAGVSCFVKQFGARPLEYVCSHDELLNESVSTRPFEIEPARDVDVQIGQKWFRKIHLRNAKGGDPSEWPSDLRVQEWPR